MQPQRCDYVLPPAGELMGCLDDLEQFLHEENLPTIIHAGFAHAQFEAIHPFLRRQWPRRSTSHHAAARRARHPAVPAVLSECLLRGRTCPHPTHRRSIGALAGTTRRGSGRAPGASFGAVCRKSLLDHMRTCQGDERCLRNGPARRGSAGGSGHRLARRSSEAQPRLLRANHA